MKLWKSILPISYKQNDDSKIYLKLNFLASMAAGYSYDGFAWVAVKDFNYQRNAP